ncbi:hypothetical protein L916_02590, partial [Phytophthora nicotianae]
VAQVRQLWDEFYEALSEDFNRRFRAMEGQAKDYTEATETIARLEKLQTKA